VTCEQYQKCLKPDCTRDVPLGVMYCCWQCAQAALYCYEIDSHSNGCDVRAASRAEQYGTGI
jgi:hypothetical protein